MVAGALGFFSFAQTTKSGQPESWKGKIPVIKNFETMPQVDVDAQLAIDSMNLANSIQKPYRFGYEHITSLGLNNSGKWSTTPAGDRVWRLGIFSEDALSINLIFDQFRLPEGAKLYLYNEDHSQLIGAYTSANNNEAEVLGTVFIYDDNMIVELFEPKESAGQSKLRVGTVVHGYRKLAHYVNGVMKALNSSGDCNVDVDCPAGAGWEQQRNSVAMMIIGGGLCTGALVNNTANDGTPYFLTANHCGTNHGSTVFRFRWESPTPDCATTANSPGDNNVIDINGSTTRAYNDNADFCLVELNSTPPTTSNPDEQIYYNGWDYTESAESEGTGIHHPSGDIKKISHENDALSQVTTSFNGNPNAKMWQISNWDIGVTEPGSSGSPLFNVDKRQIGVLSGGAAACQGTSDNNQYDIYGRFGIAWDDASGASNRLKPWLDPNNSNPGAIDGYDPNAPSVALDAGIGSINSPASGVTICASSITPEVTLRNYGSDPLTSVTIATTIDGGVPDIYNWTGNLASGSSTTVTLNNITLGSGAHSIDIQTTAPNGGTDQNSSNDMASGNFSSVNGGGSITMNLTLDCFGDETSWSIKNSGGTTLYSGGPYQNNQEGTVISETFCLNDGECYDFVIEDSYGDGLNGAAYSQCGVDGDYEIVDGNGTQLVVMQQADFGNSKTENFCVTSSGTNALEALDFNYKIYPNPAQNNVTVTYTGYHDNMTIQIIDISGKVVYQQSAIQNTTNISLAQFSAGYYAIKISNETYSVTDKLIVQ